MWLPDRLCVVAARTQGLITDFLLLFLIRWGLKGLGLRYVSLHDVLTHGLLPFDPSALGGTVFYGVMYFTSGLPELILACMWAVYAVLFLWLFGQTLGMQSVGLALVDERGMKPGLLRILIRQILSPLSSIFWAGYLIAWFTPQAQTLHDLISRTQVVFYGKSKRNQPQ